MNIAWLDQLDFRNASGGGERYKKALFNYIAAQKGITCDSFTPNYFMDVVDGDLFILSDPFNQPNLHPRQWFDDSSLERIIRNCRYVTFDTGWSTSCFVDYFPCNNVYKGCHDCSCKEPRLEWLRKYYNGALANIFLSPLHQQVTERLIEKELPHSILMRPPINTELFRNTDEVRDIDVLFVGVINEAKGVHKLLHEYGGTAANVVLAGPNLWQGKFPTNFKYLGMVENKFLPKLYNRAKNFWAATAWYEAFGLTTAEATLCGCTIIHEDKSGAISWKQPLYDKSFYTNVEEEVWTKILGMI